MRIEEEIGQRILARRHEKNISQHQLAKMIGRSQSGISLIEKGERGLDPQSIMLFCKALDFTPNGLFGIDTEIGDACVAEISAILTTYPDLKEGALAYTRYIAGGDHVGMES